MTPPGNSPRTSRIHPPEQLLRFFPVATSTKSAPSKWFSLTTRLFLHAFFPIPPGDASTFQGASPWVPPSLGFPCRMHKRHNWRKYVNNWKKHKTHTEKTTIDIGNRPQISVTISYAIPQILPTWATSQKVWIHPPDQYRKSTPRVLVRHVEYSIQY